MPNMAPKCQYDDALVLLARIYSHAERRPLPLDADRLPPGAPKARPFRAVGLSILCTALLAGWYASGTVLFTAERYEAPPIFQASKLFPPGLVKGPNIRSTSGCRMTAT